MKLVEAEKKSIPKFPCMVGTRFSYEEKEKVQALAEEAGMSLCAYLRARALGFKIQHRADTKALNSAISKLNQLGGLLKHLHSEGQKIPWNLLKEIEAAIKRVGQK